MNLVRFFKFAAFFFCASLISAQMAEAGHKGEETTETAKDAVTRLALEESATVDIGVGEPSMGKKGGKPRMSTMGVWQTWAECVGMDADEAVDMIKAARPDLRRVIKIKEGSMVTMDMRMDRVRVYYDERNVVTRAPRVG